MIGVRRARPSRSSTSRRPPPTGWVRSGLLHLTCVVVGTVVVVPVLYGVLGGFKDNGQLSGNPLALPHPWRVGNYLDALTSSGFWRQLTNSAGIALSTTLLVVLVAAMAAFVFARFAFRGRELLFTVFAIGLMFPFAVAVLPLFVLMRAMGLLGNPLGVVLPQAAFGLPVTIIILRSFFRGIPAEIEESATLDGCGPFRFFWRILLPMARPALATVSILAIVGSWNNFMLPLMVFDDPEWWTLPLGVQQFQTQYVADTARVLAYVVLAMLPALAAFVVGERQLIGGLTSGTGR